MKVYYSERFSFFLNAVYRNKNAIRTVHGWDYRRFVAKKASISAEKEIQYTTEKISANFSNFSSWHYRSKLLPVVYADTDSVIGVTEEVLQKGICQEVVFASATCGQLVLPEIYLSLFVVELRLVENAVFTDPGDQSAWFYMRWLMGQGKILPIINYLTTFSLFLFCV